MVPDALASSQTYTGGARKLPSFTSKLGGLAENITKGKSCKTFYGRNLQIS
jgi:hypothetical protein